MNKETGGAAFPRAAVFTSTGGLASVEQDGMTMRDWFAGLAMQGFAANPEATWRGGIPAMAAAAYEWAEAMLEARK